MGTVASVAVYMATYVLSFHAEVIEAVVVESLFADELVASTVGSAAF
jgi:hypothetical protein